MDINKIIESQRINLNRFPGIRDGDILFLKPSVSSGINWFDPPSMYTDLFLNEIKHNHFIKNYTTNIGYPIIVDAVKFYENRKYFYEDAEISHTGMDLCVTAGGTPSIVFLFDYLHLKNKHTKLLFLGLSYYLFYECMCRSVKIRILYSCFRNKRQGIAQYRRGCFVFEK